jgi:NADH-quinone oxidoreductase subunit N
VTMTFGNLVAIQQKQIVRLLAYSSIAQAGYMLVPLGVASATNGEVNTQIVFSVVAYLLVYAFMETGAFAVATAFGRKTGKYLIEDYAGLFARSPALAIAMAAFLFSLAGIPPFAGWWAKFVIFQTLIEGEGLWLAVIMAINTVIAMFFYLAVVKKMFVDKPEDAVAIPMPRVLAGAIGIAAVVVTVGGFLPDLFGRLATNSNFF